MRLTRNLIMGVLGCLLLSFIHTIQVAQSALTPPADPIQSVSTQMAQSQAGKPDAFYQKARKDLNQKLGSRGDDYYTLYRVIERLARANSLDRQPWRLAIIPTYDVNAFAKDINLLAFFDGLLDQIAGDPDAIACVVGHEMAHHTQKHIPTGAAEQQRILQQLRQESVDEVTQEQEDLKADLEKINIGTWVSGSAGQVADQVIGGSNGLGSLIGGALGGLFQSQRERRIKAALERIEKISAEKEAKQKEEWRQISYRHEFEADKFGYQYMVRAGFQTQGCITLFNVFEQLPNSQIDNGTHPLTRDRIAAVNALGSQYPTAKLVNEGKAKLAASPKPLTYGFSKDGASLRINSKSGSTDIDQRLPK